MPAKKNRNQRNLTRRMSQVEPLESRLMLASDWTNPIDIHDVDGSDSVEAVAPLDAVLVVNELNRPTISDPITGKLPELGANDADPSVYFDVNGDGYVSPLDALMVVNRLNTQNQIAQELTQGGNYTYAAASVMVGSRAALAGGVSDDTLVNTETDHVQKFPDVASTSGGDSVVVWQSLIQDGSGWGIFGQRFDPTGTAVGSEFQVNSSSRGGQTSPAVAMNESGGFVVVWQSVLGSDGSGFGVYAQEYDSSGSTVGGETLVNVTTRGKQCHPDVAFSGDDYTVVWQGRGSGDVNGIFARTFSGSVGGAEVLVNTQTRGFQGSPVVDGNASGSVVVAWQGKGDDDVYGVYMRDIGNDGSQILVNSDTQGAQRLPAISVNESGDIAVAWHNPPKGIWARTFSAEGTAGSVIQVSSTTPGVQTQPDLEFLTTGGFAVVWQGNGVGDHFGTFARTFGADGAATSDETLVNQTSRAAQARPSIAAANEGYIVSWQGRGQGDRFGTFARFFETDVAGPFRIDAIADGSVDEGSTFTTTASVTDSDNSADAPVFSLTTAPTGATIDAATGVISWTTTEADGPGTFEFVVAATAGEFSQSDSFNVTVNEVNSAPALAQITDVSALVDNVATFTVSATDADAPAQTLTFSATGTPAWLTFDAATQTFSGTPTAADAGVSTIEVTVDDGAGGTDSQSFMVTATGNQAPTLVSEIADASVNEAEALSVDVSGNFSDPESNTLTYSAAGLPSWASLDSATGVMTGTPGNADVAGSIVTITATDSFGGSVSDSFQLTVIDVNTLTPTLLESSFRTTSTAANGSAVGMVFAQDLDPSAVLSYTITAGNDDGAYAIDSSSGDITVADSGELVTGSNALTVEVSDGTNVATAPVTIVVDDANPIVEYSLQIVDPDNGDAVLTTAAPGQVVHLVLSVRTVAAGSDGVFSAYTDIVFNPDTVTAGGIVHSSTYGNGTFGDVSTAGLIDRVGGTDGLSVLGDGVIEVARVPMTIANVADGTLVVFATNDADAAAIHATTVFGNNTTIQPTQQAFGVASVMVATPQATVASAVDAVFAEEDEDE